MPSICLLTGSHLCRNPRVIKEANALAHAGYEVTILGPSFSETLAVEDAELASAGGWQHLVTCDLRPTHANRWSRLRWRCVRRLAVHSVRHFGWESHHALGYGVSQLLSAAKRKPYDLFIGHQEIGLWASCALIRSGRRAGADLEDWYSRDLLPDAQQTRPLNLLRQCEAHVLRHGAHATTTSIALAEALATAYDAPPPRVLYNAFPWADRSHLGASVTGERNSNVVSLHWVSQTIGPGRGLETLAAAVAMLGWPIQLHLRGARTTEVEAWLRGLFPNGPCMLYLHDLVPNRELLRTICEHDIGLALESHTPDSRNCTVTNKILHCLLAGLAVVASDTAGQREIAAKAPEAILLYRNNDAVSLAAQLRGLINGPDKLRQAKVAALNAAEKHFCWERQVPVLLESVAEALRE